MAAPTFAETALGSPLVKELRHTEVMTDSKLVQPNTDMDQKVSIWLWIARANDPVDRVFGLN